MLASYHAVCIFYEVCILDLTLFQCLLADDQFQDFDIGLDFRILRETDLKRGSE